MRRIVSSMSCATVLSTALCLTWISGCGHSPQQSQEQVYSTMLEPTGSGVQLAAKTETQSTTSEKSATPKELSQADRVPATPQEDQGTVASQQPIQAVELRSTETRETPAEEKAPAKPKRKPIYDETADAQELIAKAVRRAKRDHKQVLIEWGGNWCGWCHLLHDCFTKVPEVSKIVYEEYELVLIDSNSNSELMKQYAGDHEVTGFPHLTILNEDGEVLTNQDTEPLEKEKGHDLERVTQFLSKWMLPKVDAEQLVSQQTEHAKQTDKRVLFRVGDPYCGWCKVLSQFIQDHESLFAKDYVDVKIDVLRMTNGEKVAHAHQPSDAHGHPWFIILDPTGEVLATSVSPKGNIGYPGASNEIAHFMKMLRDTRKSLTDEELASIETDLHEFRVRREKKLAEQASK